MDFLVRLTAMFALLVATVAAVPAQADYDGADGYGTAPTYQLDVSHDGYVREGHVGETDDPATYVVIETESGTTEQVDGETVIVVQEPDRQHREPSWWSSRLPFVRRGSGSMGTGLTEMVSTFGWTGTAWWNV